MRQSNEIFVVCFFYQTGEKGLQQVDAKNKFRLSLPFCANTVFAFRDYIFGGQTSCYLREQFERKINVFLCAAL